jgi:mono/diheme cytochrome c family protein
LDTLWVLLLIGLALCVGGLLLRALPAGWVVFLAIAVVFGFGIPALVIDDHKSKTSGGGGSTAAAAPSSGSGGTSTTSTGASGAGGSKKSGGKKQAGGGGSSNAAALAQGKQIFTQNCGTCHTLADAGTSGKIGPVLDSVKPDKQLVLSALKNGGLGSGTMPANIVTGKDADAVATYVSTVAGK